jgi:hypothetical protein
MKEITRQVITISVLILALFAVTYWAGKKTNKPDTGVSFAHVGLLERNTPGIPKHDTFFLHYETDDAGHGAWAEVVLTDESLCGQNNEFAECQGDSPLSGFGFVKAEGSLVGNVLNVTKISTLVHGEFPYPDETKTPYHISEVYGALGTITLKGYMEIEKRVCNPGDVCSATVDYADFVFSKSDNPNAPDALFNGYNNPFVGPGRVGLGCYEKAKKRITYQNDSDRDSYQGTISGNDLSELLASSTSKLVDLKFTAMVHMTGKGAPDCYSAYRYFDVL